MTVADIFISYPEQLKMHEQPLTLSLQDAPSCHCANFSSSCSHQLCTL